MLAPASASSPDTTTRRRAFLGIILSIAVLWGTGALDPFDRAWLDARFQLRRFCHADDVMPQIVLVAADETSLAEIPEPLALWHRPLAAVMRELARAQPKAVGIDLALPERPYEDLLPGGDAALASALVELRRAAPLILAMTADSSTGRALPLNPLFAAAAGLENNGLAYFPRDADGRVRRFAENLGTGGEMLPTLAGQIARRLGVEPRPGLIDFSRGGDFEYLPLHRLVNPPAGSEKRLAEDLRGRIVLVGTALPFLDRHLAPVGLASWEKLADQPGLVLQAQALRSLLAGTQIRETPSSISLVLASFAASLLLIPAALGRQLAWHLLALAALALGSLLALDARWDLPAASGALALAASLGTQLGWQYRSARAQRAKLLATFGGFVSPQVLQALLNQEIDPDRPLRRPLVFLFADLRDFSGLTQRLPPETVFSLLNRYYAAVTPVLHEHGATIDNFRGDGMMAFFGAPQELSDPPRAALAAARAVVAAVTRLNRELVEEGLPELKAGIALAQGEAVIGNIGGQSRNNYTALADAANIAAHLQSIARQFANPIIASPEFAAGDPEAWLALGRWTLKDGRTMPVYGLRDRGVPDRGGESLPGAAS